ncbi:hypothetical protein BT93_J0436 [Corymbia citriodora subsp. variegata]|nr:hypothetical protein BT93_J0436 [Corymbia citriodora subsp. variegata]
MENAEDIRDAERMEEGEFIPNSPDASSVKRSANVQYSFDWSKSSTLLKNMARDSRQETIKEAGKSLQRSPDASHDTKDKSLDRSDVARPSFLEFRSVNVACNYGQNSARERVTATLRLFRDICRELEREKSRGRTESIFIRRIDFHAAKEVKRRAGYVHSTRQFIGEVPGVEVGDKFRYRMELTIVGLHRHLRSGIDYMGTQPDMLATSVVASWDYADDLTNPEELVYMGQGGGIPRRDGMAEDQKLTHGNLALANSMKRNKPVRVIRKDCYGIFTYDGLYVVERFQKVSKFNGKKVFEFKMKRLPGQPQIFQKNRMKGSSR